MSFSEYRNSTQFQIDKNQKDRNSMNPAEFFGTNEFGDNSGSSTINDSNNQDVKPTDDGRGGSDSGGIPTLPNGMTDWSQAEVIEPNQTTKHKEEKTINHFSNP